MKSLARFGSILGLICLIATALLASVFTVTAKRINAQTEAELQESLKEVMPDGVNFEPVTSEGNTLYYKVTGSDGRIIGAAFKASSKGYSSVIDTIAGMKTDGTINAIKIVSQQETPGLGSRIVEVAGTVSIMDFFKGRRQAQGLRPWFQAKFDQKNILELDQIEAITGATISSQAVINSVKEKAVQIHKALTNG